MNKVAKYLNEHLSGEVVSQDFALSQFEVDNGLLARRPEMVVQAANMNDIRKVMRFCSQLAEKGHVLPVFVRGYGTDETGAAANKGIAIDEKAYMNRVVGIDPRQQLIHAQAGISLSAINATLSTHKGLGLPRTSYVAEDGTIGGAISTAPAGMLSGSHGHFASTVQQLEVVLSNGDVIQTGRISRRDLSKKKGLSTFEGEIYREVDNLISDNAELIAQMDPNLPDTVGYSGISRVKQKDGSFDLTPLFIGSQGSLGIICEVIMKAQFVHPEYSVVAASYKEMSGAQSAVELAIKNKASSVEIIDGRFFRQAASVGKVVEWAPKECFKGSVVLAIFDDFSDRARNKAVKKLTRKLESSEAVDIKTLHLEEQDLFSLHSVLALAENPSEPHMITPRAFSGILMAPEKMDSFIGDLKSLEAKCGVNLPVFIDFSSDYLALYPTFDSKKVSERQKILQLLTEIAQIIEKYGGSFAGFGGDGRLKVNFIYKNLPDDEKQLYSKVKQIFDPSNIFNPGMKAEVQPKELASELNAWCKLRNQA